MDKRLKTAKTGPDFAQLSYCPYCGHKLDTGQIAGSESSKEVPRTGDLGVCIQCAGFLIYTDDKGATRPLTPPEFAELDKETMTELEETRLRVQAINRHG